MPKPFSMQSLLNLARQRNESAIQNLGKLNQQQHVALAKLATLQQFLKDYQEKFQEAARLGMAPSDLRNFQDFIFRLEQAIKQQQGVVEFSNHSVNAGRADLNEAKRKMQSFDTLSQRHFEAEKIREAKAEQKVQDEHSGRFAIYQANEKIIEELEGNYHE